jgi:hypothetical protein
MTAFYFYDPNQEGEVKIYELSSTSTISISSPAVVTKSPVEDGSSIVDNYFIDNTTASFSGIITQIRVAGQTENTNVTQWIGDIRALRKSKVLLTLVAHTEVVLNCLITKFDLDKNKDQGLTGWKCSMDFQEVDISERARIVEIKKPKEEVKDEVPNKARSSSSSTKNVALGTSTGVDIADALGGT